MTLTIYHFECRHGPSPLSYIVFASMHGKDGRRPAKRIHPTILPLTERHKFPRPLSAKRAGAAEGKELRESNEHNLRQCLSHGCRYLLIDDNYAANIERFLSEDIL